MALDKNQLVPTEIELINFAWHEVSKLDYTRFHPYYQKGLYRKSVQVLRQIRDHVLCQCRKGSQQLANLFQNSNQFLVIETAGNTYTGALELERDLDLSRPLFFVILREVIV